MRNNKLYAALLSILTVTSTLVMTVGTALVIPASYSYAAVNPLSKNNTASEEENEEEGTSEDTETEEIQWEIIKIANASELVDLANKCSLDTWSQNKYIKLTDDIHLAGTDFDYFPTFGGIFDGDGHTIDGLIINSDVSYLGLFSKLQPGGLIKNLTVGGNVNPGSKQIVVGGIVGDNYGTLENCTFEGIVKGNDYTGAIVGYNEETGIIMSCKSHGTVIGQHYTGGIAGTNCGGIYRCTNSAEVNTSNVDKSMSIEDINIDTYLNGIMDLSGEVSEGKSLDTSNNTIDTGGIVGHSSGIVEFCTNKGNVGYERVGYNIGGIAGRQSGYLHGCKNEATVLGRKDVGGIVGQAEPYVQLDLTEDIVNKLTTNINELHDLVDKTLDDSGDSSDTISNRLAIVQKFVDSALEDTSYLSGETINFVNGLTSAGNEALSRADYAMDEAGKSGGAVDKSKDAMDDVGKAATDLDKVAKDSDIYSYMTPDEKVRYDAAKDRIKANSEEYNGYYSKVYQNNYNYYLKEESKTSNTAKSYHDMESDANKKLIAYKSDDTSTEFPISINSEADNVISYIKHADETNFPDTSEGQKEKDEDLIRDASSKAETESNTYAEAKYTAAGHSKNYEQDLKDDAQIMTDIIANHQSEMTSDARRDLESASNNLNSAANNAGSAASQTTDIFKTLNGRDDITLPVLGDGYKARTSSFVTNLQGMSEHLGYLNEEMNSSSNTVIDDMSDVNDSFNKIMLLFTDAMDGALDGEYADRYEDESFAVAEECIDGTVADSYNTGTISGDLDVAGIAGAMGIEYDFDLEGDVTGASDSRVNSTYKTKCVVRANKNEGRITAQKNYAGGIAGIQEMGTILYSENYGRIASNTADYVGGIAGNSISSIRNSYSKGILSGGDYIGGIAGYGHEIYDSYAIPSIIEADSFFGAIAGEVDDDCKLRDNFFVSEELAGIDRISYSGMAEPVSYSRLLTLENLPDDFKKMKITFLVDDEVIGSKEISYGMTMIESQYPDSIQEEDYYIDWDTTIVHDVTADMEIIGEPALYRTTIASSQLRTNNQSVVLVDGKFKDSQVLKAKELTESDSDNTLGTFAEGWKIRVPKDGQSSHQFRLQLPEEIKKAAIYVKTDGKYRETDTTTMGMYQLFDVEGQEVSIIIVDKSTPDWVYIACILGGLAVVGTVAGLLIGRKKKKSPKKPGGKEKKGQLKKKTKKAREARKEIIENSIEKAQQLLEEARDDSPRGEK